VSGWFARNRWRYPADWKDVARAVKDRAGWRCEACGTPHGPPPRVLTVDHLDHNPENCSDENLIALCQRCHLRRQALYPRPTSREEAIRRLRGAQHHRDGQGTLA
jgi:5-methylcytosine-specific restriction endonuclease McrA